MDTYPLRQLTLVEAIAAQFRLVDLFQRYFNGFEALEAGDYGSPPDLGRSRATAKVEAVLSEYFGAEDAVLTPGAGTGSLRSALMASLRPGARVVRHVPPVYATTSVTFRAMGIDQVPVDFNDSHAVQTALESEPDMVYVQHSRQRLGDRYDLAALIQLIRQWSPRSSIVVDDNYTALQVPKIGSELGADLSAFSLFKLLGDVGVGCVVGKADVIRQIREDNYSGGSKIQGPVAISTLKGMVYAPTALAIQAQVVDDVVQRLNAAEITGVRKAYVANHQERVALVELERPIARSVLSVAWKWGGSPYPVGSASKYETSAMVYRVSRAMVEDDPELAARMLRVSPFRAGPDTILRILREAIGAACATEETMQA
jgi:hypothetical protein